MFRQVTVERARGAVATILPGSLLVMRSEVSSFVQTKTGCDMLSLEKGAEVIPDQFALRFDVKCPSCVSVFRPQLSWQIEDVETLGCGPY